MLEIYAEKKKVVDLVRWHGVGPDGKLSINDIEKYAIPGGNIATEVTIRKWARSMGYKVNKTYHEYDDINKG